MTIIKQSMPTEFKERKLRSNFCKKEVGEIKKLISASKTFTVVGMPGIGISIFLRYLCTRSFARFVHVDVYLLPKLNRKELFELLLKELGGKQSTNSTQEAIGLCKKSLEELTKKHKRVVVVFNRFDQLEGEFNKEFFNVLRSLRDVDKEKVVMVFSANKPLIQQTRSIDKGNLYMFSTTYYLKPYSDKDLKRLLKLNVPDFKHSSNELNRAIQLSGGHYQLLLLLLKSERLKNPLLDNFVSLQLEHLYENLSYFQKIQVRNIASKKPVNSADAFLKHLGVIKKRDKKFKLFTPLFTEYIKKNLPVKFSSQEWQLLKLLEKSIEKVVTKDKVFETLWKNPDESSDWALNALVYRLRKNPSLKNKGYLIESHKRVGYSLHKI